MTVALKVNLSVLKAFIAALLPCGLKYTELTPSYVDCLHVQAASPRSQWTVWHCYTFDGYDSPSKICVWLRMTYVVHIDI